MGRYGRLISLILLSLVLLSGPVSAANLTFHSPPITLIPTTVGQYYSEINASNLSWVVIGSIVPEPLVDTFGGGAVGWAIVWFWVLGLMFIIMFGRQKNVYIPLIVFFCIAFFVIAMVSDEFDWMMYIMAAAGVLGVIVFLARKK